MKAAVYTSQLLKGLPITKDTLDSLIGKPIHDSNGNTIGKVSGYSDDKETIFLDLPEGYLDNFDGDVMVTVQVDKCKMCNGKGMIPIGPGIRGIKSCPLCNGGKQRNDQFRQN